MYAIDISKHQARWNAEQAKQNGVDFVLCRCYHGIAGKDSCFDAFASEAKRVGLPLGTYIFQNCIHEIYNGGSLAKAMEIMSREIDEAVKIIKNKGVTEWVALDQENEPNYNRYLGLTPADNTTLLNAAGDKLRAAGFSPCLYASASWINGFVQVERLNMPLWVAYYYSSPYDPDFSGVTDYKNLHTASAKQMQKWGEKVIGWQYGRIGYAEKYGVGGQNVDRNIFYKLTEEKNMEFTPVKNQEYCVKEESKVACQIFNSANVDDVLGNLQRGQVLPIVAKGETQAFGTMNGTWYKVLFAGEEKYVVNLDDRSFVRDVVKEKSLHITALNDGDFYDLASTALRYGGVVKLEGFDNE